jgi:competence protein ComEC
VLDVGDGLSQVLELPGGRVMVVDGGGLRKGRFKVGRAVVAPFVRWLGYRRIDWLVASHPHRDHASGIAELLEEFPAGKVFLSHWPGRFETYERIKALAKARAIPVVAVKDRLSLAVGGARVDVIPCSRCSGCRQCVNRGCLVVRAENEEGCSLLLTADIDRIREAMLLEEYGKALASDVMVVPHHGSLTSSSEPFLSVVHPSLALVSSASCRSNGADMVPAAARYRSIGCSMLCTATSGAVSVTLLKGLKVELVSGPFKPTRSERKGRFISPSDSADQY